MTTPVESADSSFFGASYHDAVRSAVEPPRQAHEQVAVFDREGQKAESARIARLLGMEQKPVPDIMQVGLLSGVAAPIQRPPASPLDRSYTAGHRKELEGLLGVHTRKRPTNYYYHLVVTTGQRCFIDELDSRLDQLRETTHRANTLLKRESIGANLILRAYEFSVSLDEEKPPFGPVFHPHCHTILESPTILKKKTQDKIIAILKKYAGGEVLIEAVSSRSLRKLTRYLIKGFPSKDIPDFYIPDLHKMLSKRKLVSIMGSLVDTKRELRRCHEVPYKRSDGRIGTYVKHGQRQLFLPIRRQL